jgi:hypothetical protein
MKRKQTILTCLLLLLVFPLSAQEYTAREYWTMEQDPAYNILLQRQDKGELLSDAEQKTLSDYKLKLSSYFEKMSDEEKSVYYKNRSAWKENKPENYVAPPKQGTDVYAGEKSKYTQYLVTNGIFGAFYGAAASAILGVEDGGVVTGITLLSAGASVLVPVFSIKDKYVSYNSLALSNHGKLIGAMQGAAFSLLLIGDNIDEGKFILGMSTASSIALGRVGYTLGRNKPWSEGRAALYSYYGTLMPLEGLAIDASFESDNPRVYGLTSLVFGAGGYLIADKIADSYDYSRGDVTATATLATLNGLLGFSIFADIEGNSEDPSSALILIPATGFLGGTLAGHLWLKDARLSIQQGRNVALASAGGSLVGLGFAALFSPENAAPYYCTAYITGMSTYALMVGLYKKNNSVSPMNKEMKTGWSFNFTPQNIFINKKIAPYALSNPGKRIDLLPAFSASLRF